MLGRDEIADGLRALGLSGAPVAVHSSLSAFGHVNGGADTVAGALVDVCSTVLAPTFCSIGRCEPPDGAPSEMVPRQNGTDVGFHAGLIPAHSEPFDPDRFGCDSPLDREMGAVPHALLGWEGAVRSGHPSHSWVAIGDGAHHFVHPHPPDRPLAPIKRLADDRFNGHVLLLGCSLKRCTAIHHSEEIAGRRPFVRWIRYADGEVRPVRESGCSEGFDSLAPYLESLARRVRIGRCEAIAYPIRALVRIAGAIIHDVPQVTRCRADSDCTRCEDAIMGGPLIG